MRTEEELKQIAKDLYAGRIFTNLHLQPSEQERLLFSIFMPLVFLKTETKGGKTFMESEPFLIYEYVDRAGPMAINGYPIFTSFQSLNEEEYQKMIGYYSKVKQTMEEI